MGQCKPLQCIKYEQALLKYTLEESHINGAVVEVYTTVTLLSTLMLQR